VNLPEWEKGARLPSLLGCGSAMGFPRKQVYQRECERWIV